MKIEVLYKEVCNLFGDSANVRCLEKAFDKVEIIKTSLNDEPYFVQNDVDFIYLGAMTEKNQELVIKKLLPFKNRIKSLIDNNKIILATGNALEVFGQYIEKEDGKRIDCLGIFDTYAVRNFKNRHNSLFLGTFKKIKIVGYKSQFSKSYYIKKNYFIKVLKGIGLNENEMVEGINKNNFFGTYVIGPILVLNPYFLEYLLTLTNKKFTIPFKKEAIDAYQYRLKELEDDNIHIMPNH